MCKLYKLHLFFQKLWSGSWHPVQDDNQSLVHFTHALPLVTEWLLLVEEVQRIFILMVYTSLIQVNQQLVYNTVHSVQGNRLNYSFILLGFSTFLLGCKTLHVKWLAFIHFSTKTAWLFHKIVIFSNLLRVVIL